MRSKHEKLTFTADSPALSGEARGFTLIEIMLALGVLGIGMVLVATLFPPAIMQARQADRNTVAMVLEQNARAIIKTRCEIVPTHDRLIDRGYTAGNFALPNEFVLLPIMDGSDPASQFGGTNEDDGIIDWRDASYAPRRGAGWQVLARRIKKDDHYQFVVVPFILPATAIADASASNYLDQMDSNVFANNSSMGLKHIKDDSDADIKHNVEILQTELDGCLMLVKKADFSGGIDDLDWLSIGSPVILDGTDFPVRDTNGDGFVNAQDIPDNEPFLGKCVVIQDIRDYEDKPSKYWAVQLSDDIFDVRHPLYDVDDEDGDGDARNDIKIECGVWVFSAGVYAAKSPAIGAYVFTATIPQP